MRRQLFYSGALLSYWGILWLLFAAEAFAEDSSYFERGYGGTAVVRPESTRIAPETVAPEKRADQMLQTEAQLPRKLPPSAPFPYKREKSYEGRFVTRQFGTEGVDVPRRLDETGMVRP